MAINIINGNLTSIFGHSAAMKRGKTEASTIIGKKDDGTFN